MPKGGARARAGRARKPTELKVLQGTFREDRHGKEIRQGVATFPRPPGFIRLTGRTKRIWQYVGKHCGPWTAESDWPAVWGLVRLIERLIQNQDAQLETETSGHPLAFKHTLRHAEARGDEREVVEIVEAKSNPLVDQEARLFDKLRPFIAMMGLSPTDRARMPKIGGDAQQPIDPIEALTRRIKR
jgi:hypothetical protein